MNLCVDEEIVDPNVTQSSLLTSTPKKVSRKLFGDKNDQRGTKHDLTPNSKCSNQPSSKRFLVGMYKILYDFNHQIIECICYLIFVMAGNVFANCTCG